MTGIKYSILEINAIPKKFIEKKKKKKKEVSLFQDDPCILGATHKFRSN